MESGIQHLESSHLWNPESTDLEARPTDMESGIHSVNYLAWGEALLKRKVTETSYHNSCNSVLACISGFSCSSLEQPNLGNWLDFCPHNL